MKKDSIFPHWSIGLVALFFSTALFAPSAFSLPKEPKAANSTQAEFSLQLKTKGAKALEHDNVAPAREKLPEGAGADWWSQVQRSLREAEYHITWQEHTVLPGSQPAWQAPNRAHNLRTYFTDQGIRVVPREAAVAPAWTWGLTLTGYGDERAMRSVGSATVKTEGNRLEYLRQDLSEWYRNDAKGLEQGFVLQAPASGSPGRQIVVRMEIAGDLQGALSSSSGAVEFTTGGGVRVLEFGKLHAVDATGRELPTRFEMSDTRLDILVLADGASYPIVVDPLLTSPSWTAESYQASACFGFSVATAGDVNGDGYSDVIVGAYGFDNGETNEGRAFLYYGNGGPGLALIPQQLTADQKAPVAPLGRSKDSDAFTLVMLGRTPYGRAKVKLECEVKRYGIDFDGLGTKTSAEWMDTGTEGVEILKLVTGLSNDTLYHWRVRLLYNPATSPFQQKSRWFTFPVNGWQEADLRTGTYTDVKGQGTFYIIPSKIGGGAVIYLE